MRTFIAIPLPAELREMLAGSSAKAKRACPELKSVNASNIHLTLKFLGEIEEQQIGVISDGIRSACEGIGPFRLTAQGGGVFPNVGRARVCWIGLHGDTEPLLSLARKVEDRMAGVGFAREARPFAAHLTLGRFKVSPNATAAAKMIEDLSAMKFAGFSCDRVILYMSELHPAGARYTALFEQKL